MLNSIQSLILTGLIASGIFIFGLLDILHHFIILTLLTIMFFILVFNLIYKKIKVK